MKRIIDVGDIKLEIYLNSALKFKKGGFKIIKDDDIFKVVASFYNVFSNNNVIGSLDDENCLFDEIILLTNNEDGEIIKAEHDNIINAENDNHNTIVGCIIVNYVKNDENIKLKDKMIDNYITSLNNEIKNIKVGL